MAKPIRPRRSVLYMPGSNSRALEKGRTIAADALIFDLEDAVAPNAKIIARDQIRDAIRQGGYGNRQLIVRANGVDTPWGLDDIKDIATMSADAILLPKVESALSIQKAEEIISIALT